MELTYYNRCCPQCQKNISYKSKYALVYANRDNKKCSSCSKIGGKRNEKTKRKMSKSAKGIPKSDEMKSKLRKLYKGKTYEQIHGYKMAKELKLKKVNQGLFNNPFKGKHHSEKSKKKMGKPRFGKDNPQFGKPAPQGSGNGWSGWYKGWYFRSLLELSYMINVIERFKFEWKTGESQKYKIPYKFIGREQNYFPDFILNDKFLIEIKPKKLWNTPRILAKKEAAIKFCKEKNLKYKLVFCKKLHSSQIKKLHLDKTIQFIDRYENKFKMIN